MQINRTHLRIASLVLPFALIIPCVIGASSGLAQGQDAALHYDHGVALTKAGKFEEAIKAFKQAIKLRPDYIDAHNRLAEAYAEIDEFKKAADTLKQAIRYQPDSATAYAKLGDAYENAGETKKAIEAYTEAIRLNPKAADVHYKLGVIHAQRESEEPAVAEYKILQTLDPKLAQELYNLIYKPVVTVVADGTVRLNVMATDATGAQIEGLTSDDFQVFEGDTPETISVSSKPDAPLLLGVAIDNSGSLVPSIDLVINTTRAMVQNTLPQDEAMLIRFISSDKLETLQEFTSDKKLLNRAIETMYIEAGQSAVVDAVYVSAQRVANYRFPDTTLRRVLVLLTDGEDRASYYSVDQLVKLLRRIDVQIFAISFSRDAVSGNLNESDSSRPAQLLKLLAAQTGGQAFFPKSSNQLAKAIKQLSDMIRGGYTIQYKPRKPIEAGVYRPVTIKILRKPGREHWSFSARPGYVFSPK